MAKFVLYAEILEDDGVINSVAQQNHMKRDVLDNLVSKFSFYHDEQSVKLQFDTTDGSCVVLRNGEKEQNDYNPSILFKTEEDLRAEEKWRQQILEHKRRIDEALTTIKGESDHTSKYVKGLLKFIEDERQAIKDIEEYLA